MKAEIDVHFLKAIHKAMMTAYKDIEDGKVQEFKQILAMLGPAFGV